MKGRSSGHYSITGIDIVFLSILLSSFKGLYEWMLIVRAEQDIRILQALLKLISDYDSMNKYDHDTSLPRYVASNSSDCMYSVSMYARLCSRPLWCPTGQLHSHQWMQLCYAKDHSNPGSMISLPDEVIIWYGITR